MKKKNKNLSPQNCEHVSGVKVQAALTTYPSGGVGRRQAAHRVFSLQVCGWLGEWVPACSCAHSILPSLTCPQKALAGMLQAIPPPREQLVHVITVPRLALLCQEVR